MLALQRQAGNRALTEMLTRAGSGPDDAQGIAADSKRAADLARSVFVGGITVVGMVIGRMEGTPGADLRGLRKLSEKLTQGLELLDSASHVFDKIVDAGDVLLKLKAMDDEFSALARPIASDEAARHFDALFGAAGELGKLLPKGPWSAYFQLLAAFKNESFFADMTKKLSPGRRWADTETGRSIPELLETDTVWDLVFGPRRR